MLGFVSIMSDLGFGTFQSKYKHYDVEKLPKSISSTIMCNALMSSFVGVVCLFPFTVQTGVGSVLN